jgi:hypothetical protein
MTVKLRRIRLLSFSSGMRLDLTAARWRQAARWARDQSIYKIRRGNAIELFDIPLS